MKKFISLFLISLLCCTAIIPMCTCAKEKEKETVLPKLYFYGGVDRIRSKDEEINIVVKYEDGKNSFDGYAKLKWQGSSSLNYEKKNYTIKFYKDSNFDEKLKVDFGWGKQNKYCLKANWIDKTHSRNIVTAKIAGKVQDKYNLFSDAPNNGAIDGFPIEIYLNDEFLGIYTMNIPKDAWMFNMDEDNEKHTVVVGDANNAIVNFNYNISEFLDWELEVGHNTAETLSAFNRLITFVRDSSDEEFRNNLGEYFNLDSLLNYYCIIQVAQMYDNQAKNMVLATYDQKVWYASLYDLDTSWGSHWNGKSLYDCTIPLQSDSILWSKLVRTFPNELAERYFELRNSILSNENIINEFNSFYNQIPVSAFEKENARWKNIPGYDLNQISEFISVRTPIIDKFMVNMYTKDAGVFGYCVKNDDEVIVQIKPLRSDVVIETTDSYKLGGSSNVTFLYTDAEGNRNSLDVEVKIHKNAFEK